MNISNIPDDLYYGDMVKVIDGFFKGQIGITKDAERSSTVDRYRIEFENGDTCWVDGEDLRRIKQGGAK
jgi:hypothetical protein